MHNESLTLPSAKTIMRRDGYGGAGEGAGRDEVGGVRDAPRFVMLEL